VIGAEGLPTGWTVSSATLGGRDVSGLPFEIASRDLGSLVLTLGGRPAEIGGDVLDARGRLAAGTTVLIFPTDMGSWKTTARDARHVQRVRTTSGAYVFRGLAAGDYYLATIDDAAMDDWPLPEFLRKLASSATREHVDTGERRVVNLVSQR